MTVRTVFAGFARDALFSETVDVDSTQGSDNARLGSTVSRRTNKITDRVDSLARTSTRTNMFSRVCVVNFWSSDIDLHVTMDFFVAGDAVERDAKQVSLGVDAIKMRLHRMSLFLGARGVASRTWSNLSRLEMLFHAPSSVDRSTIHDRCTKDDEPGSHSSSSEFNVQSAQGRELCLCLRHARKS